MPDIMENLKKRKVTSDHIKLVRKLKVTWVNCEAGAPMINSENPFGGRGIYEDMAKILGLGDPSRLNTDQKRQLDQMLVDLAYDIPAIFLSSATVKAGKYLLKNTIIDDYPAGKFNINIDGSGDYEFGKSLTFDFDLTEDHVKLLRVAAWKYWCIDPKRPYGDMTYFYIDIANAIGLPFERTPDGKPNIAKRELKRMDRLHAEMVFAMSVLFQYGELEPGVFVEHGHNHWEMATGDPLASGVVAPANPSVPVSTGNTIPPGTMGMTGRETLTGLSAVSRPVDRDAAVSISTSTNLISAQPENALLYAARASYLRQSRQLDAAINDYTKAIMLEKGNPLSYMWYEARGNCYALTGQDMLAVQDFTEAVSMQPDYMPTRYARGRSFNVLKRYKEALDDFNHVITKQPSWNYEVYYSRAVANLCLGDPKSAATDFRQFLQSDNWQGKTSPYAVLLGYVAYHVSGNVHAAKELLSAAEQRLKNPLWPQPVLNFLLDKESAQSAINQAPNLEGLTEAHWFIGARLVFEGNVNEAVAHLKWVVQNGERKILDYDLAKSLLDYIAPGHSS